MVDLVHAVSGEFARHVFDLPEMVLGPAFRPGDGAARAGRIRRIFASRGVEEWPGRDSANVDLCLVNHQAVLSQEVLAAARMRLTNTSAKPFTVTLAVMLAPEKAIHALAFEKQAFSIAGRNVLIADTPSRGAILADSPFAPRALTPQERAHVESVSGECRGEMIYDLTLAPGQTQTLGFICPLGFLDGSDPGPDFYRALAVDDLFTEAEKQRSSHP